MKDFLKIKKTNNEFEGMIGNFLDLKKINGFLKLFLFKSNTTLLLKNKKFFLFNKDLYIINYDIKKLIKI